tara:strand:+ start:488 stop:1441 length:954 start_codon:yes stop_codon:yes gene_type:complete
MIEVNYENVQNFKEKGWCILKSGFKNEELLNYKKKVGEIEVQAKKLKYKPGRLYHDYIQSFNLAAVECPLNQLVCNNETLDFFQKLELGNAINKITGWENTICTLIRLFCMGNYNYSGHWHKDIVQDASIQASIILKDESGFKIVNKEKQSDFFSKGIDKKLTNYGLTNFLPVLINEKYYDIINLKSGDIFLFDPLLYHKGSSNHKRLQFHMRFVNLENKKNFNFFKLKDFDFYFDEDHTFHFLKPENEIVKIIKSKETTAPIVKRASIFRRLKNSINYFFPLFNFLYYLRQRRIDKQFNYEIFANTAYQKIFNSKV